MWGEEAPQLRSLSSRWSVAVHRHLNWSQFIATSRQTTRWCSLPPFLHTAGFVELGPLKGPLPVILTHFWLTPYLYGFHQGQVQKIQSAEGGATCCCHPLPPAFILFSNIFNVFFIFAFALFTLCPEPVLFLIWKAYKRLNQRRILSRVLSDGSVLIPVLTHFLLLTCSLPAITLLLLQSSFSQICHFFASLQIHNIINSSI